MASVAEIYDFLAKLAPPELAAKWDNVGLLVDAGVAPTSIMFALDITPEIVDEAAALNCHLIVSHHPVIFSPLKQLNANDVVFRLASKKISAICMHTNLDAADGGVNDVLASMFDLQDSIKFADDCGRIGTIAPVTTAEFAQMCIRALGTKLKYVDANRTITRLAVVSGSGGSYVQEAAALGADALLTGEASHHHALEAKQLGINLFVAGHYGTEIPVIPVLSDRVQAAFPKVKCYLSAMDMDPFEFL